MSLGKHKLIFEGIELAGKSSIINEVYNFLESKYSTEKLILDGCHWFNSDIGIFGTENSYRIIEKYVEMAEILENKNVIFEKLFLSDQIYHELDSEKAINYKKLEGRLLKLDAKIILCTVKKDEKIIEARLKDRLNLYSHYSRISRDPKDYLEIQEKYLDKSKKTKLPVLTVDLSVLPNPLAVSEILNWIGEEDS